MAGGYRKQRFGAHLSVAGGLHNALEEAARLGCDCVQIFVKNQRQWSARPLGDGDVQSWKQARRRTKISPVVAHASYLINLASPDEKARGKSVAALVDELRRCEALGVGHLVVHPGAHMGEGIDAGIRRIARSLDEAHVATAGFKTQVALETTAGQGTTIGHAVEQLGRIIDATGDPDRLAVCVDTCHVFAAGYDIRDADECDRLVEELKRFVGAGRVACIHTNDSRGDCGSRLDRHEHVAKGRIGKRGFVNLLNSPALAHAPRILETPKGVDGRGTELDKVNLRRLRGMVKA